MLNPMLHQRLEKTLGAVRVCKEGCELQVEYTPDFDHRQGRLKAKVREHGETYFVNCPVCHDTRQRLAVSYHWAVPDERTGDDMLHLVRCFNEGCMKTRAAQKQLRDLVFAGGMRPVLNATAKMPADPGSPGRPANPVELPPGQPLTQLPDAHPTSIYLLGRELSIDKLAQLWGVYWCGANSTVRPYFRDPRVVVPIHTLRPRLTDRGVTETPCLAGWQARAIDEEGDATRPKYLSAEGMLKSQLLYGLPHAIVTGGPVVIVEGVTDVWRLELNAVALFGKTVSDAQRRLVQRHFQGRPIVVFLDADAQKEAANICAKIRSDRWKAGDKSPVVAAAPPAGRADPGECTKAEAWEAVYGALGAASAERAAEPTPEVLASLRAIVASLPTPVLAYPTPTPAPETAPEPIPTVAPLRFLPPARSEAASQDSRQHESSGLGEEQLTALRYSTSLGRVYDGQFALHCLTEPARDHQIPRLILSAVSGGCAHCVVYPDDLADFVLGHAAGLVILHDAADGFWAVHEHLRQHRQTEAAAAWMDLLRRQRLRDTQLLDRLIRLAEGTAGVAGRSLDDLAAAYTGLSPSTDGSGSVVLRQSRTASQAGECSSDVSTAVRQAAAVARMYPTLYQRALRLMTESGFDTPATTTFTIDPQAVDKFGVLTENIQVGAAIALAQVGRIGLHTEYERLTRIVATCRQQLEQSARDLHAKHPGLFRLKASGEFCRTARTGLPSYDQPNLHARFRTAVAEVADRTGRPVELPVTDKGRLAESASAWARLIPQHPFLADWFAYRTQAQRLVLLAALQHPVIHSTYDCLAVTGRTTCSDPNVQGIPRADDVRELIVAAPGHLLLAVDYRFIELVTLATICERRFGRSRLAEVIRSGVDPHAFTAAMLLNLEYARFQELKTADPAAFKQWRQLAKPINFGVPGGMGERALVDYARDAFGVAMSLDQAQQFRDQLIREVYPELQQYLAYTSNGPLARVVTLSGRIRANASYTETRNTQFQGLAADGAKLALADLIAAGFCVVGFIHDELLIELPDEGGFVSQGIVDAAVDIIRRGMEQVTYGVPVECEYAVSTCWSKRAELIASNGKIYAWAPEREDREGGT